MICDCLGVTDKIPKLVELLNWVEVAIGVLTGQVFGVVVGHKVICP